jgi:hypothetical protein
VIHSESPTLAGSIPEPHKVKKLTVSLVFISSFSTSKG